MQPLYFFYLCAIIILALVFIYTIRRDIARGRGNTLFLLLLVVSVIGTLSELLLQSAVMLGYRHRYGGIVLETLALAGKSFIAPIYVLYIISLTETWHKLKLHKVTTFFCVIPAVLLPIGFVYNVSTPFIFKLDESGRLLDLWGMKLVYTIVFFYFALAIIYLSYCIKSIGLMRSLVMMAPVVLTCISLVILNIYPGYDTIMFVIAFCFLMLILVSRRPEGFMDPYTGFKTSVAFAEDIKSSLAVGRKIRVILINAINYDAIKKMVGYADMDRAVVRMSENITETIILNNARTRNVECYNLDGGNFAVMVPTKLFDKSHKLAEDFCHRVTKNLEMSSVDVDVFANVCLVSLPDDVEDVDTLFMLSSDLDIQPACEHVLSASDLTNTEEFQIRKRMNVIIDRAIVNNYFSVFYQPIYAVGEGKFRSAEALIRLRDPEYGYISPAVFIPVAEQTGAIHKIGTFVLEEVCKFIASDAYKRLGLEYIEVNLSATQCLRADLVKEISECVAKYDISPASLNLEITETAACYSQSRMLNNIRVLHNKGFTFSLDDFGTGYSNMMRMASLPLDIVKLDRAFVCMDADEKFHHIIKNMVSMFKEMGLKIVVEGIETKEMIDSFRSLHVDYIQGFYYSKPLSKGDFVIFVERANR